MIQTNDKPFLNFNPRDDLSADDESKKSFDEHGLSTKSNQQDHHYWNKSFVDN